MNQLARLTLFITLNALCLGCASAQSSLTYEEKQAAIESLRVYQQEASAYRSEKDTHVKQTSNQNDENKGGIVGATPKSKFIEEQHIKPKAAAFVCDETREYDCKVQAFVYKMNDQERPALIKDGKYRVSIYFKKDDNNFPQADEESLATQTYEHYLGSDYSSYSPEPLDAIQGIVGIDIFVTSSDELSRFVGDPRVTGIFHLGNNRVIEIN